VPRIAPLPPEQLTDADRTVLARIPGEGLKGEGFPRNVLGVLLQDPPVLAPFLDYWVTSKHALSFSVRERALLLATDAMVDQRCLPPALWRDVQPVLGDRGIVDLIFLVSQYVLFALANVCAQVQLEPAVAGLPGLDA
jgi:hypothetical protein